MLSAQTRGRVAVNEHNISDVLKNIASAADKELLALSQEQMQEEFYWEWESNSSAEWNTYQFNMILNLHMRRWRRWEEHHNGHFCVVERIRDKYVMPRIREFLNELETRRP